MSLVKDMVLLIFQDMEALDGGEIIIQVSPVIEDTAR